jgi:hypothetical protein
MKTIVLDIYHFIFLIIMISATIWIWMRSLTICPKTYQDEYIILYHKYAKLLKENKKLEATIEYIENNINN